jgi:branched-chain amino acid transport system substrate-binding protein
MNTLVLSALASLALASPGAEDRRITVYSSLPMQGVSVAQTEGVVEGARLALRDHGRTAAGRPVRYVPLDDSTEAAGTWMPERVDRNARRAVRDDSALAYIGEFNSGATAIALPRLNAEDLLMVSPSNTAAGLTRDGAGAERGEPRRYYPTGRRTYGRIIPNDRVQARAAVAAMQADGVKKVTIASDGDVYGDGLADLAAAVARERGLEVIARRRISKRGANLGSIARTASRGDGFFYGGITDPYAVPLFDRVSELKPTLKLYAGDGVAESGFVEGIDRTTQEQFRVTVATLRPESYPPRGRRVFERLGPARDPYTIYGYEAMDVVLDAIDRAGRPDRAAVVDAFFATRDRDSVLGRYSIDKHGDTTLRQYGLYKIEDNVLRFEKAVDAGP